MKVEQKNKIRKALVAMVRPGEETYVMSQNEVAKKSGINAAYVSAIVNGEDKVGKSEIADMYWLKLAEVVGVRVNKSYWETIGTPQMIAIIAALEESRDYGRTITIVGETGSGKSYTIDELFMKRYPVGCFKITIGSLDNIGDIVDKLADAIGLKLGTMSRSAKLREISNTLLYMKYQSKKPIVIFDEAEYMSHVALCAIKYMYDLLNGICGIVMVGTEQILRNYDRLKNKNKTGIPQLYRRIKFGIRQIPSIDKRYKEFLGEIEDRELLKWLRSNCENYGELHDVLEPAKREAERLGEPLSYELVMKINGFNY